MGGKVREVVITGVLFLFLKLGKKNGTLVERAGGGGAGVTS